MNKKFIKKVADAIEGNTLKGVTYNEKEHISKDREGNIFADIVGYAIFLDDKSFLKQVQNHKVTASLPNTRWYDVAGKIILHSDIAEKLLGVDGDLATELFDPMGYDLTTKDEVTKEDAAKVLRHFVDKEEVDWSIIDD